MKNILVTAGGTATAWHICNVVKEYFNDEVRIIVTDTNKPETVPSILLADKVIQVPYSNDPEYLGIIDSILINEGIDVIIPLIPQEAFFFYPESDIITKSNTLTTIPPLKSIETLADKKQIYDFLVEKEIPTPALIDISEILDDKTYIIKPRLGFGSLGVEIIRGNRIKDKYIEKMDSIIVQEYCKSEDYEEITVEVYNSDERLEMFARKRIDVKSGVCVKMEPYSSAPFSEYVKQIVNSIKCPIAFNIQFLRDNGIWKLFDFNLRLPAGSAMSTKIGFQLTRALISTLIGKEVDDGFFMIDKTVKYVLRTYQEHAIR